MLVLVPLHVVDGSASVERGQLLSSPGRLEVHLIIRAYIASGEQHRLIRNGGHTHNIQSECESANLSRKS
ncbi:hypothetical protein J6590_061030 [Homalodisca vitripennis]|nr:hypothetical protein J6590_061030 [Homalodisca vitripennis]